VKDRKLVVNEAEAETVRLIFRGYLAVGYVSKLQIDLDRNAIRSKKRILTSGQVLGGGSFGRGALYHLLRNRIYRGEVVHKGAVYPGEHKSIVDEDLWNAVQAKLSGDIVQQRPLAARSASAHDPGNPTRRSSGGRPGTLHTSGVRTSPACRGRAALATRVDAPAPRSRPGATIQKEGILPKSQYEVSLFSRHRPR